MTRLYLVRHGESAWNAEGRLQGQSDPELSAIGREQARAAATYVAALQPDHVLASDLSRARQTAELAGHGAPDLDPRWRERGLGQWETHMEAEISRADMSAFRAGTLVPPGGESWPEFQSRVGGAIEELDERGGSWLVFTHGGCVRAAVAHLTGAEARTVAGPANGSLTVFRLKQRRLVAFNWTAQAPGHQPATDPGGDAR